MQRHIDQELCKVKDELVRMASLAETAIGLAVKALVSVGDTCSLSRAPA